MSVQQQQTYRLGDVANGPRRWADLNNTKSITALTLTVASAVSLSACGSATSTAGHKPKAAPPPEPVTVTVTLTDGAPIHALWGAGKGDTACTSVSVLQKAVGETAVPITVTLEDAQGTLIGTQTLPETGGVWNQTSFRCTWPVEFSVTPSTFYRATVTSRTGTTTSTGDASGEIHVEL